MTVSVNEVPLATITAEIITQIGEDLSSSHIITGLASSDGGGLVLDIASGTARIAGYRADSDGTVNQTLTNNDTNYVYFSLTTDASARVNGAEFLDFTTTQAVNDKILIAEATVSGGAITDIIDQRVYLPITSLDIRNIPAQNAGILTSGTLALARIPATLTGKDADTVDAKEPGTGVADIAFYDGSNRVIDSAKLEGSTKSQVQNHTPAAHEGEHRSGGGDPIDGPIPLAGIPATLTGKDADSVDGKEPGAGVGDLAFYNANTRVNDSAGLEGSNLSEVRNHTPQTHEASHISGGSDEIDSVLSLAAIPAIYEVTAGTVPLDNTNSTGYVTLATTTVSYSEARTDLFIYTGSFYNNTNNQGGGIALRILPFGGYKETALGASATAELDFQMTLFHVTTLAAASYTYVLLFKVSPSSGTLYLEKTSDMIINSWKI